MKKTIVALAVTLGPALLGQNIGNASGPSILSQGANTIGQRSGQDLDLRFFANGSGIYDTGLLPYAVQNGALVKPEPLWGLEAGIGAYGRHTFRRSVLGLDYNGNFRHYTQATNYDGVNQNLNLGYTWQKSRRLLIDTTASAGTQTYGTAISGDPSTLVNGSSLLFDDRTTFVQAGMNTTYLLSSRTSVTVGGTGYTIRRKAQQLVGANGYNLSGSIRHQVGRDTTVGVSYQHTHYDYPRAFGESDLNTYTGLLSRTFARTWRLDLTAGVYTSEVQGIQNTALDPTIAALLGVGSVQTIFYKRNIMPTGTLALTKTFRRSSVSANYARSISPGNGLYLTSRLEAYGASYSYTGLRRWTFSVQGSTSDMRALGQQLLRYRYLSGSTTVNYRVAGPLNVYATYMRRRQDINSTLFQQDASRVSFGIAFQPGDIPLSFH